MFEIESLDVMIGIITIYLMFALACTAMVEAISAWLKLRSNNLETALNEFLHGELAQGDSFVTAFYAHPLVQSLSIGTDGRPSYIEPAQVSRVITDLIAAKSGAGELRLALDKLPGSAQNNRIKGLLESLANDASDDLAVFRKQIESQYDAAMDRASGWYKRSAHNIAFGVSAALVVFANVDTLSLVNTLSTSPEARAAMVELAYKIQTENQSVAQSASAPVATVVASSAVAASSASATKTIAQTKAELAGAGIQLGWNSCPETFGAWISKIIGLLISALAIALGAPFWFDVLGRVMKVRTAGVAPKDNAKTQTKGGGK